MKIVMIFFFGFVFLFMRSANAGDRALVIGIADYPQASFPSTASGTVYDDVLRINGALKVFMGYQDGQIKNILGQSATKAEIVNAFDTWLIKETNPEDRVFIYFSGYGGVNTTASPEDAAQSTVVMLPSDGKVSSDGVIENGILLPDFDAWLTRLESRKVTLVIDSREIPVTANRGGAFVSKRAVTGRAGYHVSQKVTSRGNMSSVVSYHPPATPQGGKGNGGSLTTDFVKGVADGAREYYEGKKDKSVEAIKENVECQVASSGNDDIFIHLEGAIKDPAVWFSVASLLIPPLPTKVLWLKNAYTAIVSGLKSSGAEHLGKKVAEVGAEVLGNYYGGKGQKDRCVSPPAVKAAMEILRRLDASGKVSVSINGGETNLLLGQKATIRLDSQVPGRVALYDLRADGTFEKIFPNKAMKQGARDRGNADDGVGPQRPLLIPDPTYGFRFVMEKPVGEGMLIAIVSPDGLSPFDAMVGKLKGASLEEATRQLWPVLEDMGGLSGDGGGKHAGWSAATLTYMLR